MLSCIAVVMVGAMILTTYTASADRQVETIKYNALARARTKAYAGLLTYCLDKTDSGEVKVIEAMNGSWGSGDVAKNIDEDFLGKHNFDCSDGNLISEAFNQFASVPSSGFERWDQWSVNDKADLFCDMFDIKVDGSVYGRSSQGGGKKKECTDRVVKAVNENNEKAFFIKNTGGGNAGDGIFLLHKKLNEKFKGLSGYNKDIISPYSEDEKYYVYRGLAGNYCIGGNKWQTNRDGLWKGAIIRVIDFELGDNTLKIQPRWAKVENDNVNAEFIVINNNSGTKMEDIDCYESSAIDGLNFLIDEPTDSVVTAAGNTLLEYLKDDCKNNYVEFYNKQKDYYNALTNEQRQGDKADYVKWFGGLENQYDVDLGNFCTVNWPSSISSSNSVDVWPGEWPSDPDEWPKLTVFECNVEEYINELLSTNPDPDAPGYSGYDMTPPSGGNSSSASGVVVDKDPCYQSAGSLGWALCPIMSGLSNTLTSIYEDMVEPFLAVNPRLLGAEAEKVVRDVTVFANVAIIIFLLMVIFSQLTGVGIDNYGIKKSLPKLIVTAVLVNLSFVICQVAVDLSNVVGSGANSMLAGVDVAITTCDSAETGIINGVKLKVPNEEEKICVSADISSGSEAGTFKTMVNIASVGLVGIGVGSIALGIASSGWLAGLIIPIFLLLITAVIAVLFFFVLLGVRQAGVVILAVLSPLALACYMLPNTKRFFDKWKKAFTGLLVLYPICGLLIGGGQLAAKILISASQDYVTYFAGCLIMVVPFFFIPSLLKGSFAAMGNIGAKISGIGKSLGSRGRGRMEGAIKNSDRYKNRVKYNQDRAALRRANRTIRRLNRRSGGDANNLSRRQQARMGAAVDTVLAQRKGESGNARKSGQAYFAAMQHKQDLEDASEARAVEQYNDPNYRAAREISLSEEARRQRSKDRTALALDRYREDGLAQLGQRWERAFSDGNVDELDALTNVMTQRYGTSAANSIGQILSRMHDVNGNENYRRSLRALQQTMGDNSTFAGNMKAKASDAFQMISDAGTVYNNGALEYHDLDYFSEHNNTSSDIKDWSTQSADTLRRAIASGALRTDMIEEILNSTDPSVRSGIQSDRNKRNLLQAALYNQQHNPSGMGLNLTDAQAAQNYRQAESDRQAESELYVRQELAAERRGRTTITVTPGSTVMGTPPVTFEGYAVPSGFNTGGAAPVQNANGEWIYTDATNNRRWNASTGLYEA